MISFKQATHLRKLIVKHSKATAAGDLPAIIRTASCLSNYINSLVATTPSDGDSCPNNGCEGHLRYAVDSDDVDNIFLVCNKCWRRP